MAFPVTPLPLYVGLAAGADPITPATWNFTDITGDAREAGDITIQAGRQNEGDQADATQVRMTLDNSSGNYCRTNPLGTWYGLLDKGSPIQVRITRIVDSFTRSVSNGWGTEPTSGLTWSHASPSSWATTGTVGQYTAAAANTAAIGLVNSATGHDVEISSTASMPAVMTGAAWVHSTVVRYADANNFYRLHCEFGTGGSIGVKIVKIFQAGSTDLTSVISTGVTYSAGTRIRTRVRAVGPVLQIRCWLESGSEPTVWHAQVSDSDVHGVITGVYEWRVAGNTNAGSLTVSVDDYRMDTIRATTPVPEWPVRWDLSGRNVTAPIAGSGILRRLSQGQPALRSPIYRQLSAQPACGYWPLEDGADSVNPTNAVVGGPAAFGFDFELGQFDCPAGASSAAVLNTNASSYITGVVPRWTVPQDGYAGMAYFRLPSLSVSGAPISGNRILQLATAGTVVRWVIYATSTGFYIEAYDSSDTLIVNTGSFAYALDPSKWFALQLETGESGGTVFWSLLWNQVGGTTFYTGNGSYAGTADRIISGSVLAPVAGTGVSSLWLGDDSLPFVDSTFMAVSAGYAGERAGARLVRLAAESGVQLAVIGSAADTALMGAQSPGDFMTLARTAEAADQGVLYEGGAGLTYLPWSSRINPQPVMTLDFAAAHIGAPPEPVDDDQRLRNRIELSRTGGGRVIAENDTSIAKSGTYTDAAEVVLQDDAQLPGHAGWRLHLGTLDELRWPRIELNLARNPSLIGSWCAVRVGSRITVAHPPAAVAGQDLDLIVEGWTETFGPNTWDVVLNCSPARPWAVAVMDDATSRKDSRTTTLSGSLTTTATSVGITTVNPREVWSTTAVPYDVTVAGEVMTVTVCTAAAGTGPYTQTMTVTRSVNSIVKAHVVGAPVHLADPVFIGI